MKGIFGILMVCLLACTIGFAGDVPEGRYLPKASPSTCSTPAEIHGQEMMDQLILNIQASDLYVQNVQGGCGKWDLDKKQRKNLGKLLLKDIQLDQPDAECELIDSANEKKIPFGTSATIGCSKEFQLSEELSVNAHLFVGVRLDRDGEVAVVFVTAGE